MISQEPRRLSYYMASRWFQVAVLFVIIGLFALGLLWALSDAKERAEEQVVELTIRNLRTGMRFAISEALMQQRENQIASWVSSNPVRWLGSPPIGYRGECPVRERKELSGGEWCFGRETGELVYRPHNIDHLRVLPEGRGRHCSQLSWRVVKVPGSGVSGDSVGLRIETASPCQLILE